MTAPGPGDERAGLRRELAFLLTGLPLSVLGAGCSAAVLCIGGPLSLTLIGLPLLAAGLRGARRLGRVHARLAETLLGVRIEAVPPRPRPASGTAARVRSGLADAAGWRAMLYLLLRLPVDVLCCAVAIGLPVFGVWAAVWVPAAGAGPGWSASLALAGAAAALVIAPAAVRAAANLQRLLARTLLGPGTAPVDRAPVDRAPEDRAPVDGAASAGGVSGESG